jgi:hypothetical protein
MVALIKIAVQLLADGAWFAILLFRPSQSVQAENLFLRRQLALFKERAVQPRRIDAAVQRARCSTTAYRRRKPNQLGYLGKALRMAGFAVCSTAEDDDPLAACWVAPVLAMEV